MLIRANIMSRVYTDLGVFDVGPQGAQVLEIVEGLTLDELRRLTGVKLEMAAQSQAA